MTEKNIAEIDVSALQHNFRYLRDKIQKASAATEPMCVVKADAEICVPALFAAGARHFAVSSIEEAEQIYEILDAKNCVAKSILILGYTPAEYENVKLLARHKITQAVYSLEYAKALSDSLCALRESGVLGGEDIIRCHIKLDSGMNRLGFDTHAEAAEHTVREICAVAELPGIRIDGIFSHFACADEGDIAMSKAQFDRYDAVVRRCEAAGVHFATKHICNSAGALRFPAMYQDMVRLGIGLYGISPIGDDATLHPISTLKTIILQIHDIPSDETVGYSRRGTLNRPSRIAALPIGYADGLNRKFGNGRGYCIINGQKARYVGNICMDVCMADVTDIDCKEGDEVEIFGPHLLVTRLAEWIDTIPYEILPSVSTRIKRVYYSD